MREFLSPRFTVETIAEKMEEMPSNLNLKSEEKTDVIISLLTIFHHNINAWTSQVYQVVIWAVAIIFGAVSYVFINPKSSSLSLRIVISFGLLFFGLMIQLFLRRANRAFYGNRMGISKCEAALRLYEPDAYLKGRGFFVYSKDMLHSRSLEFATLFHLLITLLAISFVLLGGLLK